MGRMAGVVWLMVLALVIDTASAAESGAMAHLDIAGIAVAMLSAALVLTARLSAHDGPATVRSALVDYT